MKKLLMMAMMVVASSTAFAGDSDALKAILKAKSFAEAEALVKSSLGQLANDQEKAKAYNKLVELAYEKYKKEDDTKTTNQVMQKNDPIDKEGMVLAGMNALNYAIECDKYDILPDAKGKVKPAFQKKNQDRLKNVRIGVLNGGIDYANDNKNEDALKCFEAYMNSAKAALFEGVEGVAVNDPNRGVAAFYGGRAAAQLKDFAKATDFFKVGVQDTAKQIHDLSFEFLLYSMRMSQNTKADSVKYLNDIKELYGQYPDNEQVYGALSDAVIQQGTSEEVIRLADEFSAKNPVSSLPHVYKGYLLMQQKKYDESIAEFDKVSEDNKAIFLQCVYNRAVCKWNKAAEFNEAKSDVRTGRMNAADEAAFKDMLMNAQKDFEKAKELDPDQMTVKWGYLLKNIYTQTGQQEKADAIL
jgi:tetratricopeptide (TPR) repeat protein